MESQLAIDTTVKNPLTVIAIFCGVAETSGAACLPFLAPEVQATYVWFLMLFPALVVVLFFSVLYLKHKVLYAPSDYKDERNFMVFTQASVDQVVDKIRSEQPTEAINHVTEEDPEGEAEQTQLANQPETNATRYVKNRYIVEEMALSRLSQDFKLSLVRHQTPRYMSGVVFDAVHKDGNETTIVEVIPTRRVFNFNFMQKLFSSFRRYYESLSREEREETSFIIVCADTETLSASRKEQIYDELRRVGKAYSFPHRFIVYGADDLNIGIFG